MAETPGSNKSFLDSLKDYIALAIVVFSFAVLIVMLSFAFRNNASKEYFQSVKDIIGLFLPVIGTWMGTILAFYFTKQNFEAANRSMQQTIDKLTSEEKLKAAKVSDVMIKVSQIDTYPFNAGETWQSVPVSKYIEFLDKRNRKRLVIFDSDNKAQGVFHKSTLNEFLYRKFQDGMPKTDVEKLTLQDLMDDAATRKNIINSMDFISANATLFEARQRMVANENCSDVFITASGKSNEPVTGWISNVLVTEYIQV